MKDLTFTNGMGDKLTVKCGGFGGDNVLGTVEEASSGGALTPVKGATVVITDVTNGQGTQTTTNANGVFDEDLDVACNDLIVMVVSWVDAGGKNHHITARFRCTCDDSETKQELAHRGRETADDRFERISQLEARIPSLIDEGVYRAQVAQSVQWEALTQVLADLSALARDPGKDDDKKKDLDKRILEELKKLLEKIERFGPNPPPPDYQWLIMLELIGLILKLVSKVFLLQGLPPPEFPLPKWLPDGQGPTA
jgi:hypothetical protein